MSDEKQGTGNNTTESTETRTPPARRGAPLYGGWLHDIAKRFDQKITNMRAEHSFDLGPEFEIAICEVLRELLPERAAVCRGFVVEHTGNKAGDDIIVYDAARFPTLRSLGRKLEKKEDVPAEAVLAYIEAKHTLYIGPDDERKDPEGTRRKRKKKSKTRGQHITKALQQIAALKSLKRAPIPLECFAPGFMVRDGFKMSRRPGFPETRNPWYAMILAARVSCPVPDPSAELALRLGEAETAGLKVNLMPDVIAAGNVIAVPTFITENDLQEVRPFLHLGTATSFTAVERSLGLAIMHLTWAIEHLLLGDIPWAAMMHDELRRSPCTSLEWREDPLEEPKA